MVPRSFFTSLKEGAHVGRAQPLHLRGIAFGGDSGVAKVLVSTDAGRDWQAAQLGRDHGKYSFRRWDLPVRFVATGPQTLMVKAVNTAGVAQPDHPNWNAGGFMRNVIESISVQVS
jgi:Mo-co oxidoreductase dimerisation domain